MADTANKTCTTCKQSLPLSAFAKSAADRDGLKTKCKACQRLYDAARYPALRQRQGKPIPFKLRPKMELPPISPENPHKGILCYFVGPEILERFWSKVDKRGPDECWEWNSWRTGAGYGGFKITTDVNVTANRVALALHLGRDLGPMMALHSCDNPPCCNPNHLRAGTAADNALDRVQRGRGKSGSRSNPKLESADIARIIAGFKSGLSIQAIADNSPMSTATIARIRRGEAWKTQFKEMGWSA